MFCFVLFCSRVKDSRWALQRAKFVVEYEYAVVGILEQMNETLHVLEQYVPRFFTGASQLYYKKGKRQMNPLALGVHLMILDLGYGRRHENRYIKSKPALTQTVVNKLKDSLSNEYELYAFCKQRLYNQFQNTFNSKYISVGGDRN